jgi:hypothetical protein
MVRITVNALQDINGTHPSVFVTISMNVLPPTAVAMQIARTPQVATNASATLVIFRQEHHRFNHAMILMNAEKYLTFAEVMLPVRTCREALDADAIVDSPELHLFVHRMRAPLHATVLFVVKIHNARMRR